MSTITIVSIKQWKVVVETMSVSGSRRQCNLLQTNRDLSFFPCCLISSPSIMNMSFVFFTAMFTLSHSHRVIHRGINGCVQLRGVKQVVKGSYMIPFQQGLNLWAPDCRLPPPRSTLPSNGTNYPATLVKQGNVHLREKEVKKERKTSGLRWLLFAFSGSH